jgi:hypothetical protein
LARSVARLEGVSTLSTADEIAKLDALRQSGALSDAEFEAEKAKLLGNSPTRANLPRSVPPPPPNVSTAVGSAAPRARVGKRAGIGCLTLIVLIVVIVVIAVAASSGGGSADVKGKVTSVVALDSNTIRLYITWTNHGKSAGSASCVLNTNVYNQFGDEVNIETNQTSTNGNVKPGKTQLLYQDIGVNNGDAQFIKPSDVSILDC